MADDPQRIPLGNLDAKQMAVEAEQTASQIASMSKQLAGLAQATDGISTRARRNITETKKAYQSIADELNKNIESERDYEKIIESNNKIKKALLKTEVQRIILLEKVKTATEDETKAIMKTLETLLDFEQTVKASAKGMEAVADQSKKVVEAGKGFQKLADALGSIPVLGRTLSAPFEKAAASAKDAAENGASKLQANLKGAAVAAGEFAKLIGPAAIIKSLFTASTVAGDFNKQLGIGMQGGREMANRFREVAENSEDARIATIKLVKANGELNKSLGVSVEFSGDATKNFIRNTEYLGASAEAAAKVEQLSMNLGVSSSEYASSLASAANEAGQNLKVHMPLSQIMEKIKGLSTTTLLNFRNSPKALAEGIVMAEKLGMSFEQIRNTANQLLNFEQSISDELEAEVLTGKDLNLEQARLASLRGDDVTLMRELNREVGTLNDFQNMSVIQRESIAKALGMTADQMGTVLLRQDMINKLGDRAKAASDEQLQNAQALVDAAKARNEELSIGEALRQVQEQADATKKFEDVVIKLQGAFADFFAELDESGTIDKIADFISSLASSPITKFVMGMGGTGMAVVALGKSLLGGLKGATPLTPMFTKEVGLGGAGGGTPGSAGKMLNLSKGNMMRAGGFALGGALVQMGGNYFADEFEEEGNIAAAKTTDVVSGAGQGALYGAAIGSIVPGIGTAAGAIVGGAIGLLSGALEASERGAEQREEERKRREEEQNKKQEDALRKLAEKEARIYMDSNQVGLGLASGNNYAI